MLQNIHHQCFARKQQIIYPIAASTCWVCGLRSENSGHGFRKYLVITHWKILG